MRSFINKTRNKTVFAILIVGFLLLVSCDSLPLACKEKLDRPFWTRVEGEIDGRAVVAEVYCDGTEHKTKEIYNRCTVTFLEPASLSGITVSLRSDGLATLRLKDSEEEQPLFGEMIRPYLALTPIGQLYSQNKNENGYEMTYRQGEDYATYYFDESGVPKKVDGRVGNRDFCLNITKFRQNSNKKIN